MSVCEDCGSQDLERSGTELICKECGYTRDYQKFKKMKKHNVGLRY